MAYSTNPNLPKARAEAMKLVLLEGLPLTVVARKCGVHRTTIYHWRKKWQEINQNLQLENYNRPSLKTTPQARLQYATWQIPTASSRPHAHPEQLPDWLVKLICDTRDRLKRCARVVWDDLVWKQGVKVSLSSVQRVLRRHHYFDGARKPRVKRSNPKRPPAHRPGQFVQVDTVVHVCRITGKRTYYITVIDIYTRMTYVKVTRVLRPGLAAQAVLEAEGEMGLKFELVQADNGQEFSRYFEKVLKKHGITVRHSRLGKPNDNAHIERFNQTVQKEGIGYDTSRSVPLPRLQRKVNTFLYFYNSERVHSGIRYRAPVEMLQSY